MARRSAVNNVDLEGQWFGVFVHQPDRGIINVSFGEENGRVQGSWNIPGLKQGIGRQGKFTVTRFANLIHVRIKTKPIANVECQLTIIRENDELMIVGVVPLPGLNVPFATVTLFRRPQAEGEMDGICPFRFKRPNE